MLQAGFQANSSVDVADFLAQRAGRASNRTIDRLVKAYGLMNVTKEFGTVSSDAYGDLFGVASFTMADVLFDAPRRLWVELCDRYGLPAYSYRFSTISASVSPDKLVKPEDRKKGYGNFSELTARMWISFVNTLSPSINGILDLSE
ncbi:hypothetical protein C7974DRAFT_380799 [Boeremia exigua]|uniref:uncharacterized protein n=1 Tax=Boeremia exigua TaxID=749465 RepID=UPI001E8EC1D6|nr:uncharacterized protein C7974DRAFT_380799 [Boeremia exigua]KAH6613089.1 hypothetical protein C7974DRAFT_380799 [Boeremia exigua]